MIVHAENALEKF